MKPFLLLLTIGCLSSLILQAQDLRIAYNIYHTVRKDYEIYIMNADGRGKKNITNTKAVDWTYYAEGGRIFFISDRDTCTRCFFLYEMDGDGAGVRKVSDLQLEDSWMSGRNRAAELVVSGRADNKVRFQLYLLNTSDGSYRAITNDTASYFNDPVFIEDGKRIAYRYRANKRNRNDKAEIWVMRADGTERQQLTHYPVDDTTADAHAYHAGPPRWNAKEQFISYQSLQKGKYHLYAITADGKRQWQLTHSSLNEGWHAWSPDGNWLVADSFDDNMKEFDIILVQYPGMQVKRLSGAGDWRIEQSPVFVAPR